MNDQNFPDNLSDHSSGPLQEPFGETVMQEIGASLDNNETPTDKLAELMAGNDEIRSYWNELVSLDDELKNLEISALTPSPSVDLKNRIINQVPEERPVAVNAISPVSDSEPSLGSRFMIRVALPATAALFFAIMMLAVDWNISRQLDIAGTVQSADEPLTPEESLQFLQSINFEKAASKVDDIISVEQEKISARSREIGRETGSLLTLPARMLPEVPAISYQIPDVNSELPGFKERLRVLFPGPDDSVPEDSQSMATPFGNTILKS